jgi:hypothetical protein
MLTRVSFYSLEKKDFMYKSMRKVLSNLQHNLKNRGKMKGRIFYIALVLAVFFFQGLFADDQNEIWHYWKSSKIIEHTDWKPSKTAVLIICPPEDLLPTNPVDQRWFIGKKVWEKIMNLNPKVDCFFLRTLACTRNEEKREPVVVKGNTIFVRDSGYRPEIRSDDILLKTIRAIEYLQPRYSHFVRTNLNTFINIHSLVRYNDVHHKSMYTTPIWESWYPIGYSIFFTGDVASHIVSEFYRLKALKEPHLKEVDDGVLCYLATGIVMGQKQNSHPFKCFPNLQLGVQYKMAEDTYPPPAIRRWGTALNLGTSFGDACKLIDESPRDSLLFRIKGGYSNKELIQLYNKMLRKYYPGVSLFLEMM